MWIWNLKCKNSLPSPLICQDSNQNVKVYQSEKTKQKYEKNWQNYWEKDCEVFRESWKVEKEMTSAKVLELFVIW